MDEVFPRPIRLPGQPEPPREVPEERRHGPSQIVDQPIDAYGAEVAAADLAERLKQVRSGAVRVTDDGVELLSPPFTPGRDRVDGSRWARPADLSVAMVRAGLDPARTLGAMRAGTGADRIVADTASALASAVVFTPALFIAGERYWGELEPEAVSAALGRHPKRP